MKFSFKLVTTLIAVILTVCCIATVFAAADVTSFTDFPAGSWSDAALRAGVNNGLIQGKGDGTIAPKDYITRAETATIINRAFGAAVRADISQYTDVSPSKWYYAEMQKAVNMRTVEGVSSTKINPEGYITREQVFTILARALVLSDADESKLMTFADASSVSSWARGYTAALVNRGYVNGNTENRLKPKDYITREEFAQIMHNIFKQYIVGEDYKLSNATYGTTVVRTPNLTLNNLVINGDLIVADGVGRGDITLKNVRVSGRILFRGGEGKVKIEDGTTTGQFVIVHDVNGTVNFHNYRTHPLFKNIVLDTHATFLKPVGGGGTVSPGGPTGGEKVKINFDDKDYYVSKGGKLGDAKAEEDGKTLSEAIDKSKAQTPDGYTRYFINEADGKVIDLNSTVSADMNIECEDIKKLYVSYDAKGGTMKGAAVYKDEANYFDKRTPYTLLTDIPLKDNNTFIGWYDNDALTGEPVTAIDHTAQTVDVHLYAKWEPYAVLDFINYKTSPEGDFVFIDVVIDKLPYGSNAITYIEAECSVFKEGTSDEAELTCVEATTTHGGTISVNGDTITLEGVNITSGGVLFTIKFSKEKDYKDTIVFAFGEVTIKENAKILGEYTKDGATYSPDGKEKYTFLFNEKWYVVFEGEKIGDAKQKDNTSYTLADAFKDYEDTLVDGTYNSIEFKTNAGKVVTKDYVVGAGENLTEITAKVYYIEYDVIYKGNGGTIDGKSEYIDSKANAYDTSYTLISKTDPRVKRDGYIFNGWYKEGTSSSNIIEEIPVHTKGPVTVLADWTIIKYDVVYDANGGEFVGGGKTINEDKAHTIEKNHTIITASTHVPTREGYAFSGWYKEAECRNPIGDTIDYIPESGDTVTIYAGWDKVYQIEFDNQIYIAYAGKPIGEAKQEDNPAYTLGNAMQAVIDAATIGKEAEFTGAYKDVDDNDVIIKDLKSDTQAPAADMVITYKYVYIRYPITYEWNGGGFKQGVGEDSFKTYTIEGFTLPTAEDVYKSDAENDYAFKGWYNNEQLSGDPITEIPAGQTGPKTFWAKWVRTGEAVLKFTHENNEEQKTITVKVVLTNIPKNIDNLAAIEIHYTQTPSYLKWDKATKSATFGGTFIHNNKDGVLTWYNENDSITPEELNEKGGVLFTIVYPYDEFPSVEEIILSYNKDKTTLASSDFKEGTGYKLEDGKITFAKTCVIDFNETKYFVTKGGKLGDAKTTDGTKLSDVMANYKPKAGYENKGFKIKGTETKVDADTIVTDSMDIEPDDEIIYYSVTYDAGDGAFADGKHTVVEEKAYTVEKDYTVKNLTPEREGYDFAGWYYDEGKWKEPAPAGSTISKETMKNITLYAKWEKIDDEPDMFTVTLYEGTNNNKGSYEIESGKNITQTQINEKLGDPNTYSKMKGYTDSDGNVHEIAPELWYMVDGEWEIFDPETVVIDRDIDIHLFTRFAIFYYDTDLEFKGVKIPRTQLRIAYDSNTDVIKSVLDTLTAMSDSLEGTINNIEMATGIDIFQAALNKAAKLKIIDEDGNILNPEVPVPLHKLLTEELIMKQIDNYIDANINNEEFIANILRNDTVVEMLLENKELRNKVLGTKEQRDKFLTQDVINTLIVKPDVLDWIFVESNFKEEFINSNEAYKYIADDLEHVLENAEIKKIILDECIKFVEEEYFNAKDGEEHSELYNYIDTKLNTPDFINEIEQEPQLRILLKDEIKDLLLDDDTDSEADKQAKATLKEKIFAEIRGSSTFRTTVLNAVAGNDDILFAIGDVIRKDLLAGNSTYNDIIVDAINTEFDKANSTLKDAIMGMIKDEISKEDSDLKTEILEAAMDTNSDIYESIKNFASNNGTLKESIKDAVKNDIKDDVTNSIAGNASTVKDAIKGDASLLAKVLLESGYVTDSVKASEYANDYIAGNSPYANDIDAKIEEYFTDETVLEDFIENNYDMAYDSVFNKLYGSLFDTAFEKYIAKDDDPDDAKVNPYLEDAFDEYVSGGNLETAADLFIEDDSRLISAVKMYIDGKDDNLKTVLAIYNSQDNVSSLDGAFETYINANDENIDDAFNVFVQSSAFDGFYSDYISNDNRFNTLFESYYTTHVHDVAKDAYYSENIDIKNFVRNKVYTYTEALVNEYADKKLEENDHGDLKETIDKLINERFAKVVRERYFSGKKEDEQFKNTIDSLIRSEGEQLITEYVNPNNTLSVEIKTFIKTKVDTNIDTIANQYVSGTLSKNIRELIDAEIDTHMKNLINDYIENENDARKTLGELIPTYAQDAVDTLKATDAFKNTISDFTSGNGVRVNEDNIMFISILSSLMGEYDFDKIMADFAPEKVTKLVNKVGHDLAAKYVNTLLDTFADGIKDAEAKLQADLDKDIEGTEYKFTTTPRVRVYIMDDFVVDMYNKAMPKVADKLNSKELIAQNPYAQRLINKNWITELLDYDSTKVTDEVTGYSIKKGYYDRFDKEYGSPIVRYYDIVLENIVLLHDAVMWYGKSYPEATIEDKLDAVSALLGTYANKANDVIMHYINTGELPKGYTPYEIADKILDKVLGVNDKIDDAYDKFEDKYYENEDKILELVDKMKNFYTEKLDRDYTDLIDLKEISVYADGKAYPVYEIMLELYDENEAFTIDTLATAIADSDNYHGINAIEKGMNKFKSVIERFKYNPGTYEKKIVRDAYKATLESRNIKGKETGSHSVEVQRYFQYIINNIK